MNLVVTGATGFLGHQIIDRALEHGVYSHIYGVSRRWVDQERFARKWGDRVTLVNADIRDAQAMHDFFGQVGLCDVVHTAAYKHISMAQTNVRECYTVNIMGTENVLSAANHRAECRKFILISTDKAAGPVNVYGQSKAIAEQLVLNNSGTILRFGNLWNSTGSLIGKWHSAMQRENPVLEITDPQMTRYFFPIEEALEYILFATDAPAGVLIPRLKSAKIVNLAASFMFAYDKQATINIIGIRPGEKLHEQMTTKEELSRVSAEPLNRYILLKPNGTTAPEMFPDLLSSEDAQHFKSDELVAMINSTKGL